MTSQTDLDQGGTQRQQQRTYMGPSLGWQLAPLRSILSVTAAGAYTINLSTNLVMVNVATPGTPAVTLTLPKAAGSPAGAQALPGTFVGVNIVVVDSGGNAVTATIRIQPDPSEIVAGIDGLASLDIVSAYGAFNLKPNTPNPGWTLTQ